ncbi:MAG: hypothetical protein GF383_10435 [Candidatus Lokiarchaeota archaeon]|nr:hypothetical protein [Candidatus Lokiarchaeota archaeon]MBD3340978.1 hypothetical protein [Candidatus Lokiarchaeota archaeon]
MGFLSVSMVFIFTYFVINPIRTSDFPSIIIKLEERPNTKENVDCSFELIDDNEINNRGPLNSKIIVRGGGAGSSSYPKKGYRLELDERTALLGMREDDDWILFAMYLDFPRTRIKLSFDLWRDLLPKNPTAILPDSRYVKLYINGNFEGLYLLAERNDRLLFNLDDAQNNVNSSLIFQAKKTSRFTSYERDRFEQDWPNDYEGIYIMDDLLDEFINFVNSEPNEVFFDSEEGIYSKFDKLNLIDFYLYNFLIDHGDFWVKNYFIVRNTHPEKFFLIPWDFDDSFGQYGGNKYEWDFNCDREIKASNQLFNRLINNKEFKLDCQNRWEELRNEIWTEEHLIETLTAIFSEIKEIVEIDTKKWNPYPNEMPQEHWDNDCEAYIDYLYYWISNRLEYCDAHFDNLV